MTNFATNEQPRPEFSGFWRRSPINGKLELVSNFLISILRICFSYFIILALTIIVIASVVSIFLLRPTLNEITPANSSNIISLMLALDTQIFNQIFLLVAKKLTDFGIN